MNILFDERLDGELVHRDKADVLSDLQGAVPSLTLLHREEDLRPFECDGLAAYRVLPMLVALPETLEQVEGLLKRCHALGVPVVTRGAGTGLSGGALPLEQGVLLVMSRFNQIISVDPDARIARVQPGVRNLAISEAAAPYGLYYAPDPSSQIACSIGGNVAENAGGVHCLKYGLTVHNVMRVDVLTIEGERMTLGSEALDAPGFDLLALMNGSEGMLGVVTEITVKLLPKPETAKVLMASFDDVEKAGRAVGDIIAAGIIPGGLEMMDKLAIKAAEDFIKAGYPVEAEAILLCELDGVEADVDDDCETVRRVLEKAGATNIQQARDEAERAKFWAGRETGLDVLVEVHDAPEMERALRAGADLLGINNRDLRSFTTDVEVTRRLADRAPGVTLVSESGLDSAAVLEDLGARGVDAFLIGEALMRAPDPGAALRELRRAG